jgi:DNA replication and repair protein RecF
MSLKSLTIQHFRNIDHADIELNPGINLIFGENGSGKTSILEAVQYLSSGKSFRTRNLSPLIQEGSESLTIAADVSHNNIDHRIGIRRSSQRILRRIDNTNVSNQVEFSRLLPVRTLHPDSHLLISSSPGLRRRYIDWGCFYFNEHFYMHWHACHTLLKQRSACLKQGNTLDKKLISSINQQLTHHAQFIDDIRNHYLNELRPIAEKYAQRLIRGTEQFQINYQRGWKTDTTLLDVLEDSFQQDLRYKRTHHGPHRADISVKMNNSDVKTTASRGQQKLIAFVLVLSQLALFDVNHDESALLMIDDLASELDLEHQDSFLNIIQSLNHQIILTAINKKLINLSGWNQEGKMFHVKQGEITETEVSRET